MPGWNEFEVLLEVTGESYAQLRPVVVQQAKSDVVRLRAFRESSSWLSQTMSRVVQGWSENSAAFEESLARLDKADPVAAGKKATGIRIIYDAFALESQRLHGPTILPLAWEVILKFHNTWPDWKVLSFVRVLHLMPDQASFEPLAWAVEQADREQVRLAAADAAWSQPPPAHDRIKAEVARFAGMQQAYRAAAARRGLPEP